MANVAVPPVFQKKKNNSIYVVRGQANLIRSDHLEVSFLLFATRYDTTQRDDDFNRAATGDGEAPKQQIRRRPLVCRGLAAAGPNGDDRRATDG